MEGQMIRAGKTVAQSVASEKPKTHSGGTVFGYLASACLMLKEYLPIYGVLNSTRSKVWLDAWREIHVPAKTRNVMIQNNKQSVF